MKAETKKRKFNQCQVKGFEIMEKYFESFITRQMAEQHADKWLAQEGKTYEECRDRYDVVYYTKFIELAWKEAMGVGIIMGLNAGYFDKPVEIIPPTTESLEVWIWEKRNKIKPITNNQSTFE